MISRIALAIRAVERRPWWRLNGGAVAGHQAQFDWSLFGTACMSNLDKTGNCHSVSFFHTFRCPRQTKWLAKLSHNC